MKSVLVLMSTYNGEKYLSEQIESILSQQGVDVHLLIRDDGSSDSTLFFLDKYEKSANIEYIKGINKGCASSFALLLLEAYKVRFNYDFFAFADQDDVWFLDKLQTAVVCLSAFSEEMPIMYCSNLLVVDSNLNRKGLYHPCVVNLSVGNSLIESIATGCTMVFNRQVIELFYNYTPQTIRLHDLWIYHMCMLLGKVYYDPTPHIYYRQHGDNVVGAKMSKCDRLISKLHSLTRFWKQHNREVEAKEILSTYGNSLSDENKEVVSLLSSYKKSLYTRIRFFFLLDKYGFIMKNREDNFWFRMRVIFGCI